ncbi:hypothetical protein [Ciceribacter sp. L1K22]|nr:hypothetical protein [Ciceribacter sp. L1K22]MBO3760673.1 hypothetical protein [Ciceribacter sp. L1K22]
MLIMIHSEADGFQAMLLRVSFAAIYIINKILAFPASTACPATNEKAAG